MKGKKIAIIGLCLFMISASLNVVIGNAEDTGNGTTNASGVISSTGNWYPTTGRFTYTNGNAIGAYVNFAIDENTGTLSDYTVTLTLYPQIWYSPMDSKQPYPGEEINSGNITFKNKTIFSSIQINDFEPQAAPNTFENYLIFQGMHTFMKCVDQDGGNIHIGSSDHNTIITFEVPAGFNITQLSDTIYATPIPLKNEQIGENGTISIPDQPTIPPESEPSPWQTIWIKSDNTTTSINSYNGTITMDGQTITIELSPYAYLDVYTYVEYPAPPVVNDFWYNDLNITTGQSTIEDAKRNGIISAEGWVTNEPTQPPSAATAPTDNWEQVKLANTASNNYYTYDDPSFQMTFNKIDSTGVDVVVDSQISTGRIVIINVDKEVLQTTSVKDLLVSFDSTTITPTDTLESLMEKVQNKDTTASYYTLSGEKLTTLFVYVPHFSTHTISIKSLTSGIAAVSNVLLPIILSVLFICLVIGGIIIQKRKQRDDF
jgi:hypothetical protein